MSSKENNNLVPILDGANYGLWSAAMRAFLMSLGLWGYASGTIAEPIPVVPADPNNPLLVAATEQQNASALAEYNKQRDMTLGHLVLRVNASIQLEVGSLDAPETVWNHLSTLYGQSTPTGV